MTGRCAKRPFAPRGLHAFGHGQFQQMADRRGKHVMVALVVIVVLLEAAQRLGDVAGHGRFLRNDQCFSHFLNRCTGVAIPPTIVQVRGNWTNPLSKSIGVLSPVRLREGALDELFHRFVLIYPEVFSMLEGTPVQTRTALIMSGTEILIPVKGVELAGELTFPANAPGLVLFAHGSGSSRHSPRNQFVAHLLRETGAGTLLFDLLTAEEEQAEAHTRHLRFDIPFLAGRLAAATRWALDQTTSRDIHAAYFGSSTGAAAALVAAAELERTSPPWFHGAGGPTSPGRRWNT